MDFNAITPITCDIIRNAIPAIRMSLNPIALASRPQPKRKPPKMTRFETGKMLDEYFQQKRLEAAKRMLLKARNTPFIVARQLGYPNFSLLFRKITGIAPNEYRHSQN